MEFNWYFALKLIHILSSTVIFGTGIGTAFFMLWSSRAEDVSVKYFIARTTVLADLIFTAPTVILQPLSGILLIREVGYDFLAPWLVAAYILYGIAIICWLIVAWIQVRLRDILQKTILSNETLPQKYYHLFRLWFALGWPALICFTLVFYLMVVKPDL
jgi:uncharacterized membrane protein